MDYKASKAWHYSHNLAVEVHKLVSEVVETDVAAVELAARLKHTSSKAANKLAISTQKKHTHEKLACYHIAMEAITDTYRGLKQARELRYVDQQLFERLRSMATTAHSELKQATIKMEKARDKETYGTEYN